MQSTQKDKKKPLQPIFANKSTYTIASENAEVIKPIPPTTCWGREIRLPERF